jgi:hypothetical protein
MKKNSERKFMSVAIRNGSVCVLALGAVVGLATVGAASDDSLPTALGSAQLNGVASTPSGEETFLPEANILISPILPLYACCPPPPPSTAKFICDNVVRVTLAQCRASGGVSVRSCDQCPLLVPAVGNAEEEVDTMRDDSLVTEPAAGSAWNLLVVTLFLASL